MRIYVRTSPKTSHDGRFKVSTKVKMWIQIWVMTPWIHVHGNQYFEGIYCLHFQGRTEYMSTTFLQNVGNQLQNYIAL
jgi:hypothetical protein